MKTHKTDEMNKTKKDMKKNNHKECSLIFQDKRAMVIIVIGTSGVQFSL